MRPKQSYCIVLDSSRVSSAKKLDDVCGALLQAGHAVVAIDIAVKPARARSKNPVRLIYASGKLKAGHGFLPLLSLCAYQALRETRSDVVIFLDCPDAAFYALLARNQGLWGRRVKIMLYGGKPLGLPRKFSGLLPYGRTAIEQDFIERRAIENADATLGNRATLRDLLTKLHSRSVRKKAGRAGLPGICVCLPTFNRPRELQQALESYERQTYKNFSLIVVDDGSTDRRVAQLEKKWRAAFKKRQWRWLRQDNAGPAAARMLAVKATKSQYIFFGDDDNIALAHELECFATAAATGKADILTCIPGLHPASDIDPPPVAQLPTRDKKHPVVGVGWTPVGGCPALAAYVNCLGDTNALYRRKAFLELGGFKNESGFVFEDYELQTRAVLAGYKLEVIPEPLYLYRRHTGSRSMDLKAIYTSHIMMLEPFLNSAPRGLHARLRAIREEAYKRHRQMLSARASRKKPVTRVK
ncbi:MAG: glycosyltransferase [Alphaproteobacteria bacterium]|nr:glycosyltransferase [Alphaproteobacteria bacterium]